MAGDGVAEGRRISRAFVCCRTARFAVLDRAVHDEAGDRASADGPVVALLVRAITRGIRDADSRLALRDRSFELQAIRYPVLVAILARGPSKEDLPRGIRIDRVTALVRLVVRKQVEPLIGNEPEHCRVEIGRAHV